MQYKVNTYRVENIQIYTVPNLYYQYLSTPPCNISLRTQTIQIYTIPYLAHSNMQDRYSNTYNIHLTKIQLYIMTISNCVKS